MLAHRYLRLRPITVYDRTFVVEAQTVHAMRRYYRFLRRRRRMHESVAKAMCFSLLMEMTVKMRLFAHEPSYN